MFVGEFGEILPLSVQSVGWEGIAASFARVVCVSVCSDSVKRIAAKITLNVNIDQGYGINIDSYRIYGLPKKTYYVLQFRLILKFVVVVAPRYISQDRNLYPVALP